MANEIEAIADRYQRRNKIAASRYSRLNPVVNLIAQERQRVLIRVFSEIGLESLTDLKVLEVGCGSGSNLLELIELGASPQNLAGNELLEDRFVDARNRLPLSLELFAGDASRLSLPSESFDICYQSTVFSSILDDNLQESLAQKMWDLVKPGGGVLWYDFAFNNPNNPDVRGVTLQRIKQLFPFGKINIHKVTLAPPIARRVVAICPQLYGLLNLFPFLRTHKLCYIQKT